jgi:hypothetical protein
VNNPSSEFENMIYIIGNSFLFTINILDIPLFYWIIFAAMLLVYLYLLIFPARVDTILDTTFQRLAAWDRSLIYYNFHESEGPTTWKTGLSGFLTVILIGILSATRIGFFIWIGMGALLLGHTGAIFINQLGDVPILHKSISSEQFYPIAMPAAVGILLIISGLYLLLYFQKRVSVRAEATASSADHKSFLALLFAIVNALATVVSVYQVQIISNLFSLAIRFVPFILYIIFLNDSRLSGKAKQSQIALWGIIFWVGSTSIGIQLGVLPFYFLITYLIRITPDLLTLSRKQ